MKKYLIISVIIHIITIPFIVYGFIYNNYDKSEIYDFDITIDILNVQNSIVVNSETEAKVSKKNAITQIDIKKLEEKSNTIIGQNKKQSEINKQYDELDTSIKEEIYFLNIMNGLVEGYKLPMPTYPAYAKKWGYTGTTSVSITINTLGNVSDVKLLQSSGYAILDKEVIYTIKRKWKNLPKPNKEITVSKAFKFEIIN